MNLKTTQYIFTGTPEEIIRATSYNLYNGGSGPSNYLLYGYPGAALVISYHGTPSRLVIDKVKINVSSEANVSKLPANPEEPESYQKNGKFTVYVAGIPLSPKEPKTETDPIMTYRVLTPTGYFGGAEQVLGVEYKVGQKVRNMFVTQNGNAIQNILLDGFSSIAHLISATQKWGDKADEKLFIVNIVCIIATKYRDPLAVDKDAYDPNIDDGELYLIEGKVAKIIPIDGRNHIFVETQPQDKTFNPSFSPSDCIDTLNIYVEYPPEQQYKMKRTVMGKMLSILKYCKYQLGSFPNGKNTLFNINSLAKDATFIINNIDNDKGVERSKKLILILEKASDAYEALKPDGNYYQIKYEVKFNLSDYL